MAHRSQRALQAPHKKIHHRGRKKNSLKDMRILLKPNPYEKTTCRNAVRHQTRMHKHHVKKPEAAATSAAVAEQKKRAGRAEKGPAETKKEKLRH